MLENKSYPRPSVVWLCFCMLWPPVFLLAQPKHDTLFINSQGEYPLYQHLYIYKSPKEVSPNFVWDSLKPTDFIMLGNNRGYNGLTDKLRQYWLVATLKNNLPHAETLYWWLNSPIHFMARIYNKQGNGPVVYETTSGYFRPGIKRQNTDNDVDFHFTLQSGESATFIVSLESDHGTRGYFLPKLSDTVSYYNDQLSYYIGLSVFAGIMFMALLINLFFGFFLKEKVHFWYAAYVLSSSFITLEWEGITERIVDTDTLYNASLVFFLEGICPPIVFISIAKIMQWFLKQEKSNSRFKAWVDRGTIALTIFIGIWLLDAFNLFPFSWAVMDPIESFILLSMIILVIASCIEKITQVYKLAWVYFIAVLFPFIGAGEMALCYLGINDIELIRGHHPNHLQLGLLCEALTVLMAIVYRSALHKKENETLLNNLQLNIRLAQNIERKRLAASLHNDAGAVLNSLIMHINNMPDYVRNMLSSTNYYTMLLGAQYLGPCQDTGHSAGDIPQRPCGKRTFLCAGA